MRIALLRRSVIFERMRDNPMTAGRGQGPVGFSLNEGYQIEKWRRRLLRLSWPFAPDGTRQWRFKNGSAVFVV